MFERGSDDVAVLRFVLGRYTYQHHVIRFCAAGREDDFIGIGMEQFCNLAAPLIDGLVWPAVRPSAGWMDCRRFAP